MSRKVAVVIYTHVNYGGARVYRALGTAAEFADLGDDVSIVFDGTGVETIAEISRDDHRMHGLLEKLRPNVRGVCGFCANSHRVTDVVSADGWKLLDEYKGHASLRNLIEEDRTVLSSDKPRLNDETCSSLPSGYPPMLSMR